MQSHLQREIKN